MNFHPPSKSFFAAGVISGAAGVDRKTVRNRAQREHWPMKRQGNRLFYSVPRGLRTACATLSPTSALVNQERAIREFKRAAIVLGFVLEMQRDPKAGSEQAIKRTVKNFRHLMKFSSRALRRWIAAAEQGGLAALQERKIGRVGRKSIRLERILK